MRFLLVGLACAAAGCVAYADPAGTPRSRSAAVAAAAASSSATFPLTGTYSTIADQASGVSVNNDFYPLGNGNTNLGIGAHVWNQVRGTSFQVSSNITFTSLSDSTTAPTLTGGCTSPSMTWNNGTPDFEFDVGTSCGASTITVTLPSAAHKWRCGCDHLTSPSTRVVDATSWSTTTVLLTNFSRTTGLAANWVDGDDVLCSCRGG